MRLLYCAETEPSTFLGGAGCRTLLCLTTQLQKQSEKYGKITKSPALGLTELQGLCTAMSFSPGARGMGWNGAGLSPGWDRGTGTAQHRGEPEHRAGNHGTGHGSAPREPRHRVLRAGRITAPGTGRCCSTGPRPAAPRNTGRAKARSAAGTGLKRWGSRSPARPRRTDSAGHSSLSTGPPRRARTELWGRWGWRGERRPRGSGAESGARWPRARPAALPAPAPATAPRTPRRKCGPGRR